MEPKNTISVIADGKTDYVITISAEAAESNGADIDWLCAVMDAKYGTHPAVGGEGAKTISFAIAGDPADYELEIESDGCIIVTGGSAAALKKAVQYFATQYCGYSDKDLLVDADGGFTYTYAADRIDNSALLKWEGGANTKLAPSDEEGKAMTPAWLDSAVIVEVRLQTASLGGNFKNATRLVDFYAETGVNCLWLCPIYKPGAGGNGYGNVGLHTVDPSLTGTQNMDEGWQVVKEFVDYAHSKGIYVLLDIITWGTMKSAELIQEHPDWFAGEAWGNAAFNWGNEEFKEWFITQAVKNIEVTGADGYRCDCEPFTAGYGVYGEIRKRLNDKGIFPIIMSEDGNEDRSVFDVEQDGVLFYNRMDRGTLYNNPVNFFVDGYLKIVDACTKGTGLGASARQTRRLTGLYRYYTNCITNHDYLRRDVCGNRLKIGYAAIYAPFVPVWYMGDEFGAEATNVVLYDRRVEFGEIDTDPEKGLFYEDVKKMLQIRRTYDDIFAYWPLSHRDTNIVEVKAEGLTKLQNYARTMGDRMVIVVANHEEENAGVTRVTIPFDALAQKYWNYRVTDLVTGKVITVGRAETVNGFSAVVPFENAGVYLVEGIDPIAAE